MYTTFSSLAALRIELCAIMDCTTTNCYAHWVPTLLSPCESGQGIGKVFIPSPAAVFYFCALAAGNLCTIFHQLGSGTPLFYLCNTFSWEGFLLLDLLDLLNVILGLGHGPFWMCCYFSFFRLIFCNLFQSRNVVICYSL